MKKIQELRLRVKAYLVDHGYKAKRIEEYEHTWDKLQDYMEERHIEYYTPEVGEAFLKESLGAVSPYAQLERAKQQCVTHVNALTQMVSLGFLKYCQNFNGYVFKGLDEHVFRDFLVEQSRVKSSSTLQHYTRALYWLHQYLMEKDYRIQDMSIPVMIQYLEHLGKSTTEQCINRAIPIYRAFFKYLCEKNIISDTREWAWKSILRTTSRPRVKLTSAYTEEEIELILKNFDRANPVGKRDYAMTLLAARCALRAGDIVTMRFRNLDWANDRIVIFSQQKTKKPNVHALTKEIGDAIIDYLKHGRPKVKSEFVFLSSRPQYDIIKVKAFSSNVTRAMLRAGVDISNRKHGPHSLRHSLATNLLKASEPVTVISEILGHTSVESTKLYLRVDINMLRKCALDVPVVEQTFYDNMCNLFE